jgi:hypothetical protein
MFLYTDENCDLFSLHMILEIWCNVGGINGVPSPTYSEAKVNVHL